MLTKLLNYLSGKKILILGFGKEGKSTYFFLRKHFPNMQIWISDNNENLLKDNEFLLEDKNLECMYGNDYLNRTDEFDIILKSPGVSFKGMRIDNFAKKLRSQLELLLEFVDVFTIGITGTKGKSTTSSLIAKVLQEQKDDVLFLGNIGTPIFDRIDNMKETTCVVLEISSHSLEFITKSPNIAVLINVFPEHLDHYNSLQDYVNAKYNILKYQTENDYYLYNIDNEIMKNNKVQGFGIETSISMTNNNADIYYDGQSSIYYKEKLVYVDNEQRKLIGKHNLNNIMFVLGISEILKLDTVQTIKTINDFMPLEHRIEYVGKFDEIDYYNDSIATIPESTISSIEALKNVNTIIVGGKDREVDLSELISYIGQSNIENVICLPKTGEYINDGLKNKKTYLVKELKEAVEIAKKVTKKGTICLLSPAASSYGYFKNFEERGKLFKEYVRN